MSRRTMKVVEFVAEAVFEKLAASHEEACFLSEI